MREIDDDDVRTQVDTGCRDAVEHPRELARDQPPQLEPDLATVGRQVAGPATDGPGRLGARREHRRNDGGERRGDRPAAGRVECELHRGVLGGTEAPAETRRGEIADERDSRLCAARLVAVGAPRDLERVQPDGASRPKRDRIGAERPGERPVLALRVEDHDATTERRLAQQVALHEGALPPADLAEHEHVRVRDRPRPVQVERVVDEGTAEEVAPDQHAGSGKPTRRDAGIRRAELRRRRLVGGQLHSHPRPTGSVQQKASACVP